MQYVRGFSTHTPCVLCSDVCILSKKEEEQNRKKNGNLQIHTPDQRVRARSRTRENGQL